MEGNMTRPHIVVLGLMGAGKSTLASALSERLDVPWRDSDRDIETLTGRTGRQLSADPTVGIDGLHQLEEAVLLGALANPDPTVISAAGWVVESPLCRTLMRHRAMVVWLEAPAPVLVERMQTTAHRRPVSLADVEQLVARREPLFRAVADHVFDATTPVDVVASGVVAWVEEQRTSDAHSC
jgi:shikimate kinase